ncbi:hypothetical protein ACJZ2D_016761 [Fusarium nematophilum]
METYSVEMDIDPVSLTNAGSASLQRTVPGIEQADALAQANRIYERLVWQVDIANFFRAVETVLIPWATLLEETTPPDDALSTDPRFLGAFKRLDAAIDDQENSGRLLSRLAYIQLHRLIKLLQDRVASDRRAGRIHRRSGYKNAYIVLDTYMSAQNRPSPSRRSLIERKCLARRWHDLAGSRAVFLLAYSGEADKIMLGHTQVPLSMTILLTS